PGHLRDLHSFPTRRSSDLRARRAAGSARPAAQAGARALLNLALTCASPDAGDRAWVHDGAMPEDQEHTLDLDDDPEFVRHERRLDRKSTRLNSSHVKISSA